MKLLEHINILGFILIFVSFLFGIKLPDWDFKLRLRHRSIVTHSSFLTLLLIALYKVNNDYYFKYFIVGFSIAVAIHMLFDLFPYNWKGGALLKIPININCDETTTKLFFSLTILINTFIGIFYMTDIYEYIFVIILATFTFIKKKKYEKAFLRPLIIFILLMGILGILKFEVLFKQIKSLI